LPSWQLNHQSRITEPPLVEEEEETAVAEDTLAVAEIAGEEVEAINKEVVETVEEVEAIQVVAVEAEGEEEMTRTKAL